MKNQQNSIEFFHDNLQVKNSILIKNFYDFDEFLYFTVILFFRRNIFNKANAIIRHSNWINGLWLIGIKIDKWTDEWFSLQLIRFFKTIPYRFIRLQHHSKHHHHNVLLMKYLLWSILVSFFNDNENKSNTWSSFKDKWLLTKMYFYFGTFLKLKKNASKIDLKLFLIFFKIVK